MRTSLFQGIVNSCTENQQVLIDAGYSPLLHFDWDRQQWQHEPEKKEHPFARPALFINVGDYQFARKAGKRYAAVPITVTIVQDYFVDARQRSETQDDAFMKSNYSELINDILDSLQLECLGKLELTGESNEQEYGNQLVDVLNYTAHIYLNRNASFKVSTCKPSTLIIKDQNDNVLTTEVINSGESREITININ